MRGSLPGGGKARPCLFECVDAGQEGRACRLQCTTKSLRSRGGPAYDCSAPVGAAEQPAGAVLILGKEPAEGQTGHDTLGSRAAWEAWHETHPGLRSTTMSSTPELCTSWDCRRMGTSRGHLSRANGGSGRGPTRVASPAAGSSAGEGMAVDTSKTPLRRVKVLKAPRRTNLQDLLAS